MACIEVFLFKYRCFITIFCLINNPFKNGHVFVVTLYLIFYQTLMLAQWHAASGKIHVERA